MTGVYVADSRVVAGRGVGAFTAPIFVRGLLMQNQTSRKKKLIFFLQTAVVIYWLCLKTSEYLKSVVYFIGWLISR